jgi:hypothetical protein
LYFAQEDRLPEDAAAIFILDPITLNKKSVNVDGHVALDDDMSPEARAQFMKWHPKSAAHGENLPTVAVSPVITNRRMLAQRAAFTLCGDSFESLESLYPDAVHKVVLPATTFAAADQFLELVGIGPFGYYPDLDGLQRKHKTLLLQQKAMIRAQGSLDGTA